MDRKDEDMSMTDTGAARSRTAATTTPGTTPGMEVRERPTPRVYREFKETKPSFATTEFWAMLAGIALLVIVYNVADNPDLTLWRTCLLSTVIASAYIVSRGWAKSGSHADNSKWDRDYR